MANYRPKSLNELNQVYGKAMKAEKAIKEGSLSLTKKEDEKKENPSDNIFEQMQQQASASRKNEIYDADIANIANDFIKRFTESDKPKVESTPKEIRRPAPSIKSLYHTPVQPKVDEPNAPSQAQQAYYAPKAATPERPKAPENITPVATQQVQAVEPEKAAPTVAESTPKAEGRAVPTKKAVQQSSAVTPPIVSHREVSPVVHITSTERSNLMEEYQRVMSDDYDDEDDTYIEKKSKKRGLFSRKKKYRSEGEAPFDSLDYGEGEEKADDTPDEVPVTKFDSSNVKLAPEPSQYPAEEESMNLYDYIDADFDDEDDTTDTAEEETTNEYDYEEDEHLPMSQDDIDLAQRKAEEATPVSSNSQDVAFSQDEPLQYPAEEMQEEAEIEVEATIEEAAEIEAETEIVPTEEVVEEVIEEIVEATELETIPEEVIIPEEVEEETAEEILTPEEVVEAEEEIPEEEAVETVQPTEEVEDELPTAGMTFDDIFSVTDENKRSYNGGNLAEVLANNERDSEEEAQDEIFYDDYDDEADDEDEDTSYPEKKKGGKLTKALLCILIFVSLVCTAGVVAIGSYIAPDTGKVFMDKYMAFTAKQDYSFIGVSAGDLVITDDSTYALEGDAFVYVNHDSQSFVMAKQSGSTSDGDGNELFIAENEAGRVLVLSEDTLGVITDTYSGIGGIISPISDNYIIISAVLLLIILTAILLLVIPGLKKGGKKAKASKLAPTSQYPSEDEEEDSPAPGEESDEEDEGEDEDSDMEDFDDFDPNGVEAGIFSEL